MQEYIQFLLQWLLFYRTTCTDGYKHVRIACLDEQTAKLVTHLGLHCTASTKEEDKALHPGDREDAWLYRWHAALHMLHAGMASLFFAKLHAIGVDSTR
jgi:hypothetical protein